MAPHPASMQSPGVSVGHSSAVGNFEILAASVSTMRVSRFKRPMSLAATPLKLHETSSYNEFYIIFMYLI